MKTKPDTQIALAARILTYVEHKVSPQEIHQHQIQNGTVNTTKTGLYSDNLKGTFSQISDDLPDLSIASMKLVLQICRELVHCNYLWFFDHQGKKNLRNALNELERNKIILHSVGSVHIVNPLLLRKGNIVSTVENSLKCIVYNNGICKEAILSTEQMRRNKVSTQFHTLIAGTLTDKEMLPSLSVAK